MKKRSTIIGIIIDLSVFMSREWVLNHIFKSIYWNLKETKQLIIQSIIKV